MRKIINAFESLIREMEVIVKACVSCRKQALVNGYKRHPIPCGKAMEGLCIALFTASLVTPDLLYGLLIVDTSTRYVKVYPLANTAATDIVETGCFKHRLF